MIDYFPKMSGRVKKILEEIHPLHIIREVQKWPALYIKDCPERANTHFKLKIWWEVAKVLFPEWDTYSKVEKDNKITDLTKKWRNLRDTFKRQVEIEKKIREGHNIKKKMYVYYNHMSFLLPHLSTGDSDPEEREPPADLLPAKRRFRSRPDPGEQKAFDAPAANTSVFLEEIDEDKHFVMSLIPSLKKMTEDEKLTAKVEILKVIKGVRSNSSSFNYQVVDSLAYNSELEVIRDDATDTIKREMFTEAETVDIDLDAQASDDEDSN